MGCNYSASSTVVDLTTIPRKEFGDVTYEPFNATVIDVYDGDTITVGTSQKNSQGRYIKFSIRIAGIDCAEMKGGTESTKSKARQAKEYVTNRIFHKEVLVRPTNQKEKFGRMLADIIIDGSSIADELIERKLAHRYDGGEKLEW